MALVEALDSRVWKTIPGPGHRLARSTERLLFSRAWELAARRQTSSGLRIMRASISASSQVEASRPTTWFDWKSEWYPVAIESELDKEVPHAVTILGYDLVLWWDRSGKQWQAFADKCPHRLAPLSEGRIAENGQIQCSYHGWMFAPQTGSCSFIPQAEDSSRFASVPKACATVFPSMKQQGILWVSLTTSKELLANRTPPFFPVLEDSSFTHSWATSDLPYGYEPLIENLVDPTHVPFAHHKLQGDRNKAGPVKYTVNKFDRSGFRGNTGRGDVIFMPPCAFMMESRIPSKNKEDTEKMVYLIFMCVPVLPGKSKVFWSFPRNFAKWLRNITPMWYAHLGHMLVLDSDLYLLHRMEQRQRRTNEPEFTPTSADAFVLGFRRWLYAYAGGAPDYAPHVDRKLPPSLPKKQLMDRYEYHVKKCPTCMGALKTLKLGEAALQISAMIVFAAALVVAGTRRPWWCVGAVFLWILSRYTAYFIDKNYHFHDYNHAKVK